MTRRASAARWSVLRVSSVSSFGVGVAAQDVAGRGPVGVELEGDEAVVLGGEDGVGDGVEPAPEVTEPVDGGGLGEAAPGDLFFEPVVGVVGGQLVGEALGVTGQVLEPPAGGYVVDQERRQLQPGVVVALPVGVGDDLDVVEADHPVGQPGGHRGEMVDEAGEAGDPHRGALPQPAVVLQPTHHTGVALAPVLTPAREGPHRAQQRGVGLVAGPAEALDALAHDHRRQVPPGHLRRDPGTVAEVVDLDGHGPSPSQAGSRHLQVAVPRPSRSSTAPVDYELAFANLASSRCRRKLFANISRES